MQYIKISFNNAGLYVYASKKGLSRKNIKDYVNDSFSISRWVNRFDHEKAKNTLINICDEDIHSKLFILEPISNMLHVLCDERPVPTFKDTLRHRNPIIDSIVKNGFIKIDNVYSLTDESKQIITEMSKSKKWIPNANINEGLSTVTSNGIVYKGDISWTTLRQRYYYFDNNKYNRIIDKFIEWGRMEYSDICAKYTLVDYLLYLYNELGLKTEMVEFFKMEQMMPFIHILNQNVKGTNAFNNASDDNKNFNLARRVVNSSPSRKICLNGSFIFPIEDSNIADAIINGGRYATYLDGGLAKVESISDDMDIAFLELEGYTKLFN